MRELKAETLESCFAGKRALVCLILVAAIAFAFTASVVGEETEKPVSVAADQLPKGKQTTLGLYVTAAQAYEKWKAAPGVERARCIGCGVLVIGFANRLLSW